MTAEEFMRGYAKRSGISVEKLQQNWTILPCACGDGICKGWAVVSKDPLSIKTHNSLYGPKANQ